MNWVDLLIILVLLLAIVRGWQVGLFQLLLPSAGFILGLLLGSWLARSLTNHFVSQMSKLLVYLMVEIGLAFLLATLGEIVGRRLSIQANRLHLGKIDQLLGGGLEFVFMLTIVWLMTSALANVKGLNLGHDFRGSFIIRQLDSVLPKPPDIFATLEKIISPNGFPSVFVGLEPRHTTISPTNSVDNQAVLADQKSVVQIRGRGCGAEVIGSGFVVNKNEVVTNAHVVAGIDKPEVIDSTDTFRATAIWFDPNLDIAILRVTNLSDPALAIADQVLPDNDAAAVLGYPGGGPLVTENAAIIDHVKAEGRNIYNRGVVLRDIYEVQADVEPGNSGGPLLAPDGTVAGVIFAKSVSQKHVGYALLIDQVKSVISQAEQQNRQVSTGSCAEG